MSQSELDPSHIMQVGMGFFGSRTLLSAVELELFTHLGSGELSGDAIGERLGLHPRAIPDFPDALVALGVLDREGDGPSALYGNTKETAAFLDKNSPQYVGGILEMASDRLYLIWNSLTEGLKTGQPQNEIKDSGEPIFTKLYASPEKLDQFMNAMAGVSAGNFKSLAEKFDFPFRLLCDVDRSVGLAYGAADAPDAGYAKRISYVIGEDGRILHAYAKVDPKTHLDQVLSDLAAS